MALYPKRAYISPSLIDIQIGNGISYPPVAMVPSLEIYDNGRLVGTKNGKYIQSFIYYGIFGGGGTSPTTFVFPDLEGTYGDFLSSLPVSTTSVSAPELVYVGGSCVTAAGPGTYSFLTSLNFPKLVRAVSFAGLQAPVLTTFNAPEIVEINGSVSFTFNALTTLSLPKFRVTLSSITLQLNSATSINLPSLVFCGGGITITAPLCTSMTLPSLGTWKTFSGNFSSTSNAFNQATVDNILAALAYMDGTNGTANYATGRTVTITGTSSAPSNAGSTTTAGSNFSGVGTVCTVNLTNHGYSSGDVLRISGVTTLTNANRYAQITVVNANQFTYTITSQTATGGGTATIIKAGASAKALVARNVSLTTN